MLGQKPMRVRMQEMLELINRYGAMRVDRLDRKVLKRLIKKGDATIVNGSGRASVVNGCKWVLSNHSRAIATRPAPIEQVTETGGPYAKRKKALEESGLPYRGKSWGKVRVDLPREAREKKINEKKLMWKKLKT